MCTAVAIDENLGAIQKGVSLISEYYIFVIEIPSFAVT